MNVVPQKTPSKTAQSQNTQKPPSSMSSKKQSEINRRTSTSSAPKQINLMQPGILSSTQNPKSSYNASANGRFSNHDRHFMAATPSTPKMFTQTSNSQQSKRKLPSWSSGG